MEFTDLIITTSLWALGLLIVQTDFIVGAFIMFLAIFILICVVVDELLQ